MHSPYTISIMLPSLLRPTGRPTRRLVLLAAAAPTPASPAPARGGRGDGRGRGSSSGRGRGGGGGGRGGGGRGRGGQQARAPTAPTKKGGRPPPPLTSLTAPLTITVLSSDAPEPAPPPLWATFCGTVEGGWTGVASAVCPLTGEVEALLPAGPGGLPPAAMQLATYTTEERVVVEGEGGGDEGDGGGGAADRLERATLRARTADAVPASAPATPEPALGAREPGLIIFDGGSYSRGPLSLVDGLDLGGEDEEGGPEAVRAELERLVALEPVVLRGGEGGEGGDERGGAPVDEDDDPPVDEDDDPPVDEDGNPLTSRPDAGEDAPLATSLVEACVSWGGGARLRVVLTLGVGLDPDSGELDVTPLRLLTVREVWQCPADGAVAACAVPPAGTAKPPSPPPTNGVSAFSGEWKAFDVCGHALSPSVAAAADALGGASTLASAHALYSTACTRQVWRVGGRGGPAPGDAGGAYIVPGSLPLPFDAPAPPTPLPAPGPAIVELVMLPPVSRGAEGDAAEGMGGGDGGDSGSGAPPPLSRGFLISVSWAPRDGTVVGVAREYDAGGQLVEARCRSAVRVDVAGGAM
jgi:hypothetical protein